MNLNNFNWAYDYNKFIDYLYTFQDLKYKNFNSKIILNDNLIGIRMPILKKIAKKISNGDYLSFIKYNNHNFHEEKMLYGLILGYINTDFKHLLLLMDNFIPYIDNWSICDSFCANLKTFKVNQQEGYKYIINCFKSNDVFKVRVGIVLLINFYINDIYIDDILINIKKINASNYYISMAIAWLLSMCYIKYPNKIYQFIKENDIDELTRKRTIQKIVDSKQVKKKNKIEIKKLRNI